MTVSRVIELWPTGEALASDIGVSGAVVRMWRHRNRIPAKHWRAILNAATERGIDLSFDDFCELEVA